MTTPNTKVPSSMLTPTVPSIHRFTSTGTQTGIVFHISTTTTAAVSKTYNDTGSGHNYIVLYAITANNGWVLFCSGTGTPSGGALTSSGAGTNAVSYDNFQPLATYTPPASPNPIPSYLRIRQTAGGGGGYGYEGSAGSAGGITCFGPIGGSFAAIANPSTNATEGNPAPNGSVAGGAPGGLFSGAILVNQVAGGSGCGTTAGDYGGAGDANASAGGNGGNTIWGGAGGGGGSSGPASNNNGGNAVTNSGSGGGGASGSDTTLAGSGGGAGSSMEFLVPAPVASYIYCVGLGGAGGTGTVSGGNGAAGILIVEEHYQ
jgi:hypothetical protein